MTYASQLEKRRGSATIYTIMTMLIIGFVGTAMIKMAKHDLISGADYYNAGNARVAAKAGLQAFESETINRPDSILTLVNDMVIDSVPEKWIINDNSQFITIEGNRRYRVKATLIAPENFIIQIQSEGRATGSRAIITAYYELGNLERCSSGSLEDLALYLGDLNSFSLDGPIEIKGNSFIHGNVDMATDASGTHFFGRVKTSYGSDAQLWRGTYTFSDMVYFDSDIETDGDLEFNVMNRSGFNYEINAQSSDTLHLHGNSYFNDAVSVNLKIKSNSKIKFVAGNEFPTSGLPGLDSVTAVMNIEESLGIDNKLYCIPDVNISGITEKEKLQSKYLISNLYLHGDSATAIYEAARDAGKLWHGFAVVELETSETVIPNSSGEFDGKMIIIVPDESTYGQANVFNGHFKTKSTSTLMIYVAPGGTVSDIGIGEYFRGYIYVDSDGSCTLSYEDKDKPEQLIGAIHVNDDADFNWTPSPYASFITFDSTVFKELDVGGLLSFPCTSGLSNIDSVNYKSDNYITHELLGVNY